jgi:hypothetical protein
MTDQDIGRDQRRYPRIALSKAARAKSRDSELEVQLRDISASGASLAGATGLAANSEIGLAIDGIDRELSGRVVRAFDDGIAVEFELEAAEEEALLREINSLHAATLRTDEF